MKQRDQIYNEYKRLIVDKDKALCAQMNRILAITQKIFEWKNLPETIPAECLERILQENGTAYFTPIRGEYYALSGQLGGEMDEYERPTIYTVSNTYLGVYANYDLTGDDGVLLRNDTNCSPLLPIIGRSCVQLVDANISINTALIYSRLQALITAPDTATKMSAETFLRQIEDGKLGVIGDNSFLDGIKSLPVTDRQGRLTELITTSQYIKASLYNELGLNANYNTKRERLNTSEVAMNIDALLPYVENCLMCRHQAAEKINALFNLNICCDFSSSWKVEYENLQSEVENAESIQIATENLKDNMPPLDELVEQEESDEQERQEESDEQEKQEESDEQEKQEESDEQERQEESDEQKKVSNNEI